MKRAYYVTTYRTNKTHGPFLKKQDAEAYAAQHPGVVSTLSCFETVRMNVKIYAP